MNFSQEDIDLAADRDKISVDDYLSSNPSIEVIEDDTVEPIDVSESFKPIKTGNVDIDNLFKIGSENTTNNEEVNIDVDTEEIKLDKDIDTETNGEDDGLASKSKISLFRTRKLKNKVKRIIEETEPIEDVLNANIASDRIIVKTNDDGTESFYSLYDILKSEKNDSIFDKIKDRGFENISDFINELGDNYKLGVETDVVETEGKILKDFETVAVENWSDKTKREMNATDFLNAVDWIEIFNDTENVAKYSLDNLLPSGFKTREVAWFRDRIEITPPDGGTPMVFQVDLNPNKEKQNEIAISEIAKLKTFILSYKEEKDASGKVIKPGWSEEEYKEERDSFKNEFKKLINTSVNDGGVKISEEQVKEVEDYNSIKNIREALVTSNLAIVGSMGYSGEVKGWFNQAYNQGNFDRKRDGLPEYDFSIEELQKLELDTINEAMKQLDIKPAARTNKEALILGESHGPLVGLSKDKVSRVMDYVDTVLRANSDYQDVLKRTREIAIQNGLAGQLESNIEKYAERDWWSKSSQSLGEGTAGSAMLKAENDYLLKTAELQANALKDNYLEKQKELTENPFAPIIKNWANENAFASLENIEGEANIANINFVNKLSGLTIMPETDLDGLVMEDVYVKIQGEKDDEGRDLIFIIKKGESLYENINKDLTQKGSNAPVLLMPSSSIVTYNNQKSNVLFAQAELEKRTQDMLDEIENLPTFAEQVEAWDKNYNELERFGVTLGISGISLAKDLTIGAAMLTAYINPLYWGGKMVGVDMIKDLAENNAYLSRMLEVEKEGYNFNTSSFAQGNLTSWEGLKAYGEWSMDTLADTLPIMCVMILSGGSSSYATAITSGLAGLSAAGGKMTQNDLNNLKIEEQIKDVQSSDISQEEKDIQVKELNKKIKTAGSGKYMLDMAFSFVNEAVFASLTTAKWGAKMNKMIFANGNASTRQLYNSFGDRIYSNVKSFFKEGTKEGLGETGVNTFENVYEGRPLSQGGLEAFAGGFVVSSIMGGVGQSASSMTKINYTSNKEINNLTQSQIKLVDAHKSLDIINEAIESVKKKEGDPTKSLNIPDNIKRLEQLEKMKAKEESRVADLMGEIETQINEIDSKLQDQGMRLSAAERYTRNQAEMAKLRTEALNLAADPNSDKKGTTENKLLNEINEKFKKLENENQFFLNADSFGHEWNARKGEAIYDSKVAEENAVIVSEAVNNIKEQKGNIDYVPNESEIDAEAKKIIDTMTYNDNNARAEAIADAGGWQYNNSETNAEGVEIVEQAYNNYINSLSDVDANSTVEVAGKDGTTVEMNYVDFLNMKKDNAIEGVNDGSVNGFYDNDIKAQFNFKENAIKNQKPGVPLHEGAHGATETLIEKDPAAFEESGRILVEFLKSTQPEIFNKMIVEGTNGLRQEGGSKWDFSEVFSSFVEEVAGGNIDLKAHNDFTAFFGMKLNEGLQKSSNGEFRVDFKGTNDINSFFTSLAQQIGLGEVSMETMAELRARQDDQGGEVIDINKDQDQTEKQASRLAASETKKSKTSDTKSKLVEENKMLLKEKPKGFMDKIKANAKKIKELVSGTDNAQTDPSSDIAKKAKKRINEAVDKVRNKIPAWKEGNRQKPNRVLDKLFNDIGSDLDGMIAAKAKNFVTNDKSVVDLTKNVDLKELQQAVKTELLADIRGFNKNNDSLYGYINSRLKQRIGDVLPDLWTDMSQKDIDNLSTSDTKTINKTNENKTLIESVPDVNLRESLDIDRDSPLGDLIMETVEKVLGTKMPEFKYVRKNKGGKRTNVSLADVKKVLSTNPTGPTKRQAERDLAGIYKKFSNDLEARFAEELRDAFVETFGSRTDYTNWLDINADAISDLSIEKLVAFERLVKGDKIFTEVVKENLSVEEVKQLEGTGLLVSATTNQGPTLYKKLNPTKQQVIDFFDIKGSKKGTRKDALADKISGELALNATMEIASKPEVMEKFELGLEDSGTGEVIVKSYLEDVSKAINRGVDLKFSRAFRGSDAPLELKNTYRNGRKPFVNLLAKLGITEENVNAAWQQIFGETDFKLNKNKKYKNLILKEWRGLSRNISKIESIISSEVQMGILNSIIDESVEVTDTERAELIAKAKNQALTTKRDVDFDDILTALAENLGLTKGYAYEQLVYDSTEIAIKNWNKNNPETPLRLEGNRGEDGGKADFIATIGGQEFNVELKLEKPRFGSVTIKTTTDTNGNIDFNIKKDYSFNSDLLKSIEDAKKDIKNYVDRANEIGKERFKENWLEYKFGDLLEKSIFNQLKEEGLQKKITRTLTTSTDTVAELYWAKGNGTAYMNIYNKGLYKLRNSMDPSLENPANLNGEAVPYLDGTVDWSFSIGKSTAKSKGGPTNYKNAGIKLENGKLPGSEGWANVGLRYQPSNMKGLPDAKYDMSSVEGVTKLMGDPVMQKLVNEKGESASSNIKTNSESKVVKENKLSKTTNKETIRQAEILDKALNIARDPNAPIKKIRVFDFDDTLARSNSLVFYKMPDGTEGKLTAEEFAKKGDDILNNGGVFDFTDFNTVREGKPGPLLDLAKKIQEARGTEDVFVLTARAPESQIAIKEFLDSQGLDIPIENITGLGDSSPLAKSSWMVDKAAEGYNDFYFADDALKNVDAVDIAMSVIDVKSKTQQAKIKFSKTVGEVMNDIIYDKTGIESYKEYSSMRAKAKGRTKRSFSLIPPSAQDFGGLLYKLLAKGEKGDAQWQWMQENLVKPFSRAMNDLSVAQNQLMSDFRSLKKSIKGIPTNLKKKAFGGFTYEDITRVAAWNRQGINVEGLSKRDLKQITEFVDGNEEISLFVDQLIELGKGDGYHYPGGDWLAGTITTDFIGGLRKDTRPRLLEQWNSNIDMAFDEKTFNKLEAAFGPKYVEALKDSIRRMKTGQNRKQGTSRLEARFQDYINNSVGAVMFLNARSAVLQTISAANFVNWSDNNPLKAGKAFANQKQYWTDFMYLMNSDFLVDRRNGLKINVSESEIAEAAKTTGNSFKSVVSYFLTKGFALTQFADSFAIATGGATFYRNRVNTYMKQGLSKAEAEQKAFLDFRDTAEESQQSARADKISQQQASTLGRIVLAFANTPSQYARIMDKAGQDLINGRGDAKANISKIMYYGFVQNLMFTALQSALFAEGFGDDEDDVDLEYFKNKGLSDKEAKESMEYYNSRDSKKDIDTANSMLDNIMRGLGVQGVILATAKNVLLDLYRRSQKEGQYPGPEYGDNAWKLLEVSPPISIKAKKYKGGMRDFEMNSWRPEAKQPFNINNPSYRAAAKVIAAVTNVPLDRVFQKLENIQGAMDETNESWQRVAMLLGWPKWQLENEKQKADRFAEEKEGRKEYRQYVKNKNIRKYKPMTLKQAADKKKAEKLAEQTKTLFKLKKAEQIDSLRQLGLTTDAIKRLKYEEDRVNKIIELNK